MDKPPRPRIDPLALAVLSVAVTVVLVVVGYIAYRMGSDPAAEVTPVAKAPTDTRLADAVADVQNWLESKRSTAPAPTAPAPRPAAPAPAPQAKAPAVTSNCSPLPSAHPIPTPRAIAWALGDDGRRWRYNVVVDAPASWQGATLTYQMHDSTRASIVTARFERGEKSSTFRVGIFAPGDPSHSDMRFPGFFMLPVYLDQPLENGTRFQWSTPWPLESTRNLRDADQTLGVAWMWALPQLLLETGRAKRYEAIVKKWDEVETPLGKEAAACIEATVTYVEKGQTQATVRDTYWYAPRLGAVVKAVREGQAPDESARRIAVDLVDIQPPPFELVDSRWPKDKIATDLGDGSVVAADSEFSPDRLALLRRHLAAVAGPRLAGKRVQVNTLVTWYVRTPKAAAIEQGRGLPPIPVEEYFDLPKLREYPYWVICSIDLSVDNRHMAGRGAVGFRSETPDFSRHHQEALIGAINRAIDKKL